MTVNTFRPDGISVKSFHERSREVAHSSFHSKPSPQPLGTFAPQLSYTKRSPSLPGSSFVFFLFLRSPLPLPHGCPLTARGSLHSCHHTLPTTALQHCGPPLSLAYCPLREEPPWLPGAGITCEWLLRTTQNGWQSMRAGRGVWAF